MGNREAEKQSADARNVAPGLAELRKRVEAATGNDRDLDADIMCAIGGARRINHCTFYGPGETVWAFGEYEYESPAWNGPLPHVTSDLNEVFRLARTTLPESVIIAITEVRVKGKAEAIGIITFVGNAHTVKANAPTPALALLSALLAALTPSDGGPEGPSAKNEDAA